MYSSSIFKFILVQITPAKDGKPVMIELIDAKTKEHKDTLEVTQCHIKAKGDPMSHKENIFTHLVYLCWFLMSPGRCCSYCYWKSSIHQWPWLGKCMR